MVPYTPEVAEYCEPFCCGDTDLDDYFANDAFLYEKELLGKSYCWINRNNDKEIVAIATLAYDGIKTFSLDNPSRNYLQRKIPQGKRHRSYPAVLIGRLGVNSNCRGKGLNVGTQLMDALKYWFVDENNKAACRYIIVDAYNSPDTLHFYIKNGFKPLYRSEEAEKLAFGIELSERLKSRILFFDLKLLQS
ncbi:MAG: GNAT family N-acetyltransferase [Duncaniella sp.]|nr:GNAT family N-acetyltransferase [Duncaniella sp.]MDE6582969.1 GNAT family N-acetyltransferase [Duncaniella sp.]